MFQVHKKASGNLWPMFPLRQPTSSCFFWQRSILIKTDTEHILLNNNITYKLLRVAAVNLLQPACPSLCDEESDGPALTLNLRLNDAKREVALARQP